MSPIVAAILGGLVVVILNIFYSRYRIRKEYRSLILCFGYELVFAYKRCVDSYKLMRNDPPQISYGTLWDYTDAQTLSKFSSVCRDPKIVAAITKLKAIYFQVARHMERASELAARATVIPESEVEEGRRIFREAQAVQSRALAFFKSELAEKQILLIIKEVKKNCPKDIAKELSSIFSEARKLKRNLDER